jgi:hypothetical protein
MEGDDKVAAAVVIPEEEKENGAGTQPLLQ